MAADSVLFNNMAIFIRQDFAPITPYDTGNLLMSRGDVGAMGGGVGYYMFDNNQVAHYGAILNELPTINYKITNQKTGRVYTGTYVNKHYMWVDNGMESKIIPDVCLIFNLQRG